MALNNDSNFPPVGPAPYRINREWCVGDSLGYINTNAENFDNRLISLEGKTNTANTASPLYKLNDILTNAPIFVPVNFNILSESETVNTNTNNNVQIESRSLNSDTAFYAGDIKTWYSPSFFIDLNSRISGAGLPSINTNSNVPRTVAALVTVYFNTNPAGNNGTYFYIKKRNQVPDSTTYPDSAARNRYVTKISMDPTGGTGTGWEAESDVTMVVYLDTAGSGIPGTFSWRISSGKANNPWATNTYYGVTINLLGYYVQYPSFIA
jgi:hypothetical protein